MASSGAGKAVVKLHGYFASPTSFLARIGLNVKHVPYEYVPLAEEPGEQPHDGAMPYLEHQGHSITQTGAIFNYINETWPLPPLLPDSPLARARVRSIATFVSTEIQPFGFFRVDRYLEEMCGLDDKARSEWHRHWLGEGFKGVEVMLQDKATGRLCHGEGATMADLFLIPQVHRSQQPQVGLSLAPYPILQRVYENALKDDNFVRALPENQADAVLHAALQ